jgi:hypothetical protein
MYVKLFQYCNVGEIFGSKRFLWKMILKNESQVKKILSPTHPFIPKGILRTMKLAFLAPLMEKVVSGINAKLLPFK